MWRKASVYLLILLAVVAVVVVFFRPSGTSGDPEFPISTLIDDISRGSVQHIVIRGDELEVRLKNLETYRTTKEEGVSLFAIFADRGVDASAVVIEVKEPSALASWLGLLLNFVTILIFIGLIYYAKRQAKK